MVLSIDIPDEQADTLRHEAERLGVTPEELAKSVLVERLQHGKDFDAAAEYVLSKNSELYKRLS